MKSFVLSILLLLLVANPFAKASEEKDFLVSAWMCDLDINGNAPKSNNHQSLIPTFKFEKDGKLKFGSLSISYVQNGKVQHEELGIEGSWGLRDNRLVLLSPYNSMYISLLGIVQKENEEYIVFVHKEGNKSEQRRLQPCPLGD